MKKLGIDVIIDDRAESAGIKFKDSDLIGIPLQITIGPRTLEEDSVEIKNRVDGASKKVGIDNVVSEIKNLIDNSAN